MTPINPRAIVHDDFADVLRHFQPSLARLSAAAGRDLTVGEEREAYEYYVDLVAKVADVFEPRGGKP